MAGNDEHMASAPNPYELIQSLQEKIDELELAIHNQRTKVTPLKIGKVNPFNGKRGTLKAYLAQMQLYLANNQGKLMSEADKVLAAASFLEGDAMNWFDGYLTDWFGNPDQRDTDTVHLPNTTTLWKSSRWSLEISMKRTKQGIRRIISANLRL
ncbi:hypothetical protein V1508DRAFT_464390 [Lipomyces doorenjongii]|uniref:uncharacterized protein n=1 Tax=Lipomyces doorenjongii TaxID=383834 RepID=UPI0034CD8618